MAPSAPIATSMIALTARDGHRLSAYRVEPKRSNGAGLVVLQELFGLNAHIRQVCDAYGALGYGVISPGLFDRVRPNVDLGYDQMGIEAGRKLRAQIGWDAALADVQAAIDAASAAGPVAVLGYCWGGSLAFLAATRLRGLRCAVGYYGGQTAPFAEEKIRVPVMLHFGTLDPRIPPADIERIRRGNPAIEIHSFPADHGFNCDHRKEWHGPSAKEALALTLGFLSRCLKASTKAP
jgi:carboxymethylenebutenolidase